MLDASQVQETKDRTIFASGYIVGARGFFDPLRDDEAFIYKSIYGTAWMIGMLDFHRTGPPTSEEMTKFRLKVAYEHYTSLMGRHSAGASESQTSEKWAVVFGCEIAICNDESLARAERRIRNEPDAALITLRVVEGSLNEPLAPSSTNPD
jgi:hypothetical protein